MKFVVEAFDKKTDSIDFEILLPEGCEAQLAEIMNWPAPQQGDEGYDLTAIQLARIEELSDQRFIDENHIFQLTCNNY